MNYFIVNDDVLPDLPTSKDRLLAGMNDKTIPKGQIIDAGDMQELWKTT